MQIQQQTKREEFKVVPMSDWVCRPLHERYSLGAQRGHGAYGAVYEATEIATENKVALKKMENFYEKEDKEGRPFGFPITTLRQIKLLQHLQHENILKINDVVFERPHRLSHKPPTVYLCLPLMEVDLQFLATEKEYQFTPYRLQKIVKQILQGLEYLHSENIAHRDLKPANVLLNREGVVKIGDFGLAKKLAKFSTPRVVTMWYRAPELLFELRNYSTNIDIWSLGCLLVEFLIKKPLFARCQTETELVREIFELMGTPEAYQWYEVQALEKYKQVKPEFVKESEIILHVKKIAPAYEHQTLLLDLIEKMLRLDPRSRHSASECLNHPFFAEEHLEEELLPEKILSRKQRTEGDVFGKKPKYN